jgi:Trehalose utilisation
LNDGTNPTPTDRNLLFEAEFKMQDHGPGQHDYPAWQTKWHRLLGTLPDVNIATAWEWPSAAPFADADVLVFYFWNHDWSAVRSAQVDAYQQRGGGVVVLHSATIADTKPEKLAERIGRSAQPATVKYRHTAFGLHLDPKHPITRGLQEWLPFRDEPYWPMIGDPAQTGRWSGPSSAAQVASSRASLATTSDRWTTRGGACEIASNGKRGLEAVVSEMATDRAGVRDDHPCVKSPTSSSEALHPLSSNSKTTNQYFPFLCPFYRNRPRPNSRLRKYSLTEKARTLLRGKVLSLPLTFRNHPFQSATA